VADIT